MTMSGSSDDSGERDRIRDIVRAFQEACEAADSTALAAILDPDVTIVIDGGGRVRAPSTPISGSEFVGRVIFATLARLPLVAIAEQSVNGAPGLVVRHNGCVVGVAALGIRFDRIHELWVVANPDKLRSWNASDPAQDGQ